MADWNPRANELFLKALDVPPDERDVLLAGECGDDAALMQSVHALLAAHAQAGGLLEPPTGTFADRDATRGADDTGTFDPARTRGDGGRPDSLPEPGLLAGRYRLGEPLGEGGMGTVYRAEQIHPVRRMVAVKLIKAGTDTARVIARFEAERQALAVMDHPNIAKVLDAGTTPTGQPFFVMELVDGVPITAYADGKKLTVPQRLELFTAVCAAVQHAHQKGIIHRDLKPGNVLVTEVDGKAVPKVIDFGLAKALQAGAIPDVSLEATGFGSVLGTPLYMAPEQADPGTADIDTRADVYALGVILYELLTGSTPHTRESFRRVALSEVLRMVREVDPPTPGKRLESSDGRAGIAAVRGVEPGKLARLVRGDLEWVTMKALAKERDRRYESATALAADIGRFLNHEPVSAGPPGRWYRARKFVRRNRGAVTAAVVVFLALTAGVIGTSVGLAEADAQRRYAEGQEEKAKGETAEKEKARAAEEESRKKFERQAISMQIDKIRSDAVEEQSPLLTVRLRAFRYAKTAAEVPDHAADLRQYLTAMTLLTGQTLCPLWPRDRMEVVESVYCLPALEGAAVAQTMTGTVRVCDVLTGATRVEMALAGRHLRFATVSDDGRVLVTQTVEPPTKAAPRPSPGARPARYQFWTVADGRLLAETPIPPAGEYRSEPRTLSPDGARYLSNSKPFGYGFPQTSVNLWDTATGRLVVSVSGIHPFFSPDGKWFVVQRWTRPTPEQVVVDARVHSAVDGREVAVIAEADGPIRWAEFTPDGRHLFTLAPSHARWWSTADWKPAGGPCARKSEEEGGQYMVDVDADGYGIELPKIAHQWPRRWVVRDDFAVNCWESDSLSGGGGGAPILNKGGAHSMEVIRRGDPNSTLIGGTPWAIDGQFVLSNTGRMYSARDGRVLFPPPGGNYPSELPRMARDGRVVAAPWPQSTPAIDAAVGKPFMNDLGTDFSPDRGRELLFVSQPIGANAVVGGRNLMDFGSSPQSISYYHADQYRCPAAVPGVAVEIPPDHLMRWVKVVIRGEFDANTEFRKWDEAKWQAERRELARLVPPLPNFPFPGPIVADKNYWLRQEIAELRQVGARKDGIDPPSSAPLIDRLVNAEPTFDSYMTRLRLRGETESAGGSVPLDPRRLDARVRDVRAIEPFLAGGCSTVWFQDRRQERLTPPRGLQPGPPVESPCLLDDVLTTPGLQPESYRAAAEADHRYESLPWWQQGWVYPRKRSRPFVPALAAYRLGRYDDALKELAALEYQWVSSHMSGYAIPRPAWVVAVAIRSENLGRHTPFDQRPKPLVDVLLLRALVLAKQGKAEEARAAWEAARARMRATGPQREQPILPNLLQEAEALFARPPKGAK